MGVASFCSSAPEFEKFSARELNSIISNSGVNTWFASVSGTAALFL